MSLVYTAPSNEPGVKRNSVYLGSKADAKDLSKLERFGITHILNVTPEKEAGIKSGVANYFEKNKNFTYRRIPVYDNATTDIVQYANSIVSFISNALYYGSVLVHCQRGVSRSTACVLIYLMNKGGMTLHNSLDLVKRRRPCAGPIPAFMEQLQRYEKECKEKGLINDEIKNLRDDKKDNDDNVGCDYIVNNKRKADSQGKRIKGPSRPIGPSMPPNYDNKNEKDRAIREKETDC